MLVDLLFLNLVHEHGVDIDGLRDELAVPGPVRSQDYPGDRRVLQTIPAGFPRFRGVMLDGRFVLERLRLRGDALVRGSRTKHEFSIARPPALPLTVVNGMAGADLRDVVDAPGVSAGMTILGARHAERTESGTTFPCLDLDIDMPLVELAPRAGAPRPVRDLPDYVSELRGHAVECEPDVSAAVLERIDPTDPRDWQAALRWAGAIVGLRSEMRREVPHLVIRFPYRKDIVKAVGRGGLGAWFDRDTYAWCISPTDLVPADVARALQPFSPLYLLDREGLVLHSQGDRT